MLDEARYFGCWERPGHFLWRPGMRQAYGAYGSWEHQMGTKFDGILCPHGHEVEGVASLHVLFSQREDCITALAFWDRSVDKRSACNSVFFLPGRMCFDEAVATARAAFPEVFHRFQFDITRGRAADAEEANG